MPVTKVTYVMCASCRDRGESNPGKLGVLKRAVIDGKAVLHWTVENKDWARMARRRNPGKMWPGNTWFRGTVGVDANIRERLPAYCKVCRIRGDIASIEIASVCGTVWRYISATA